MRMERLLLQPGGRLDDSCNIMGTAQIAGIAHHKVVIESPALPKLVSCGRDWRHWSSPRPVWDDADLFGNHTFPLQFFGHSLADHHVELCPSEGQVAQRSNEPEAELSETPADLQRFSHFGENVL